MQTPAGAGFVEIRSGEILEEQGLEQVGGAVSSFLSQQPSQVEIQLILSELLQKLPCCGAI